MTTDERSHPPAAAVPAATVVVVRDGPQGIETLMLHRSTAGGAFGGMWVFPGGKVDPVDADPSDGGDELGVARRAAVREALEEAGLVLEVDDLVPLAHWLPPAIRKVRFATWFFLARATDAVVAIDGHEISDHEWLSAAEVLSRRDAGAMELAPPTWVTLHTLASHASVDRPPRRLPLGGAGALLHRAPGRRRRHGGPLARRRRLRRGRPPRPRPPPPPLDGRRRLDLRARCRLGAGDNLCWLEPAIIRRLGVHGAVAGASTQGSW